MTALPKRRISSGRKRRRRSQDKLANPTWTKCIKCQEIKRPHFKCPKCGYYKPSGKKEVKSTKDKDIKSVKS